MGPRNREDRKDPKRILGVGTADDADYADIQLLTPF